MSPRSPLLLALLMFPPQIATALPWKLDPATNITVEVPWHGTSVAVRFPDLQGDIDFDQNDVETARASITVGTAGATTGVAVVDLLVRGEGYLDASAYPYITFQLDKLTRTSKSTADVSGTITLRGQTRPARFTAKVFRFGPADGDPTRFEAGFDLAGSIDRTEFGSTAGLPDIGSVLPVRIHLLMTSK